MVMDFCDIVRDCLHNINYVNKRSSSSVIYVTGSEKRGLPRTSNLPTLTNHNFRLVNTTNLKFAQHEAPIWLDSWRKFQLHMSFNKDVKVFQGYRIGWVWKTPFRKSGHIYIFSHLLLKHLFISIQAIYQP